MGGGDGEDMPLIGGGGGGGHHSWNFKIFYVIPFQPQEKQQTYNLYIDILMTWLLSFVVIVINLADFPSIKTEKLSSPESFRVLSPYV